MGRVYMATKEAVHFYSDIESIDWGRLQEIAGGKHFVLGAYAGTKEKMFVAVVLDLEGFFKREFRGSRILTYGEGKMEVHVTSGIKGRGVTVWTLVYFDSRGPRLKDVIGERINYNFETGEAETVDVKHVTAMGIWQ